VQASSCGERGPPKADLGADLMAGRTLDGADVLSPIMGLNNITCCAGIQLWELQPPDAESVAGRTLDGAYVLSESLGGALAAIWALLQQRGSPQAVVFDGMHAEDLPAGDEVRMVTIQNSFWTHWKPTQKRCSSGAPAVLFDGLHAEDLPADDEVPEFVASFKGTVPAVASEPS